MTVKFTNNASTTVGTGINASATSLAVASASSFPSLSGADDYCYLTIQGATSTAREVVKATALSGNTFTIVRAQDNTSAGTWSAGDIVELRMTAALLTDVIDAATVEGVKTNFQYTPTAGQTVFSGADNASNTLIINQAALVSVYMNGVRLVQGTDYSVSSANNTVTLTVGATTADIIDIEVFGNFTGQSGAAVAITGGAISGTSVAATTLSASGTATLNTFVSNNITVSGGSINNVNIGATTAGTVAATTLTANSVAVDNITIDGNEIDVSSGDLTLDVAGDISLDADGGDIRLLDGGTQFGKFTRDGGDFLISSSENDKHMKFAGADGGANITALDLDMENGGNAEFSGSIGVGTSPSAPLHLETGTTTDILRFGAGGRWGFQRANSDSRYVSFSRAMNGTAQAVFTVDGDNGDVGIGISSPQAKLHSYTSGTGSIPTGQFNQTADDNTALALINANNSATYSAIKLETRETQAAGWMIANEFQSAFNGDLVFRGRDGGTTSAEVLRLKSNGNVGIGGAPATARLEVTGAFAYASGANSLATTVSKASARIRGSSDASTSLFFGSLANDAEQYIQSSNGAGSAGDDLVLNPYGGNVGIGKTAGAVRIDVETDQNGNLAGQFKNTHATGSYGIKVMGGHDSSNYSAVFTDKDNATLMKIRGDGSVLVSNGSVSAPTYSFSNDTDTGVFLNSVGYLGLAVAGSKQLELGGGIIYTAANGKIRSDNNGGSLELSGGGATVGGQILLRGGSGDADIVFKAQANTSTPAERMRIRSDGEVDIKLNTNAYGTFSDNIGEVGAGNFCLQVANSAGSALKPLGFRAEDIRFATGSATRMTVNSNGNVNIGMPSGYNAEGKLHVYNGASGKSYSADSADQLILENNSSVCFDIRTPSGNNGVIMFSDENARGSGQINYSHSGDSMYFYTGGSLRGYFNGSGHLVLGSSSHADDVLYLTRSNEGKLQRFYTGSSEYGWIGTANGDLNINGGPSNHSGIRFQATSIMPRSNNADSNGTVDLGLAAHKWKDIYADGTLYIGGRTSVIGTADLAGYAQPGNTFIETQNTTTGSTHYAAIFRLNSGSTGGQIVVSNTTTLFSGPSDYRLKKDVRTLEDGLERVKKLKPVKFGWVNDDSESEGFIAHEMVEAGWSEGVTGEKDAVDENGDIQPQTLDYGRITPLLVKAIQEQQDLIESLTARVAELENN